MAAAPVFGNVVRTLRAQRRMTQAELAQRAAISERAVSDIERGLRVRVYPATVQALADAFELSGEQRADFERAARTGHRRDATQRGDGLSAPAAPWRQLRRDVFVGRQAELAGLLAELAELRHRLHTVTGPGGAGKSRLAAEACAAFAADGRALWVPLAGEDRPERLVAAIAAALEVPVDSGVRAIGTALDEVPTLLVLDTFEHLLAGATVVADLLDATGSAQLLVTSRAPLRLRGERVIPLSGLGADDAARLFRERATAIRPDLLTDAETTTAIAEIAARLEGLPLALELAAAKLHQLSLPALVARLTTPLALLADGQRDLPERQRSMRATVRWSYELLDPAARQTLRTLGCFAGVFDLAMAAGVADADDGLLDRIGRLTEQALVHPEADAARDLDAPAWRLLDPIREFAVEHLLASGTARDVRHRHAEAAAGRAEAEGAQLVGTRQDTARRRLRHLAPDIRAALRWAIAEGEAVLALRIAASMWMFWRLEGEFAEGRRLLGEALDVPGAQADTAASHRAAALWGAGWLALHQGDASGARDAGAELLARSGSDEAVRRNALTLLGEAALAERHVADAVQLLEQALELAERAGSAWQRAASHLNVGTALVHAGAAERADAAVTAAIAAFAALGDRHFAARATLERGYIAIARRDLDAARRYFADALDTFVTQNERWGTAEAVSGLAVLAAERGDAETATLLAAAIERVHADIAVQLNPPDAVLVAERLARARAELGDAAWEAARRDGAGLSLDDAVAIARDLAGTAS